MDSSPAPAWLPITEANKLLASCSDRASALRDLDDLVARGGIRVWATGVTSLYRNQTGSSRQPSGPVQAATWATIRNGPLDFAMWATGVATLPASPTATGLVLKGIRLERAPFLHLLEEYGAAATVPAPVAKAAPEIPTPVSDTSHSRTIGGATNWRQWDRVWSAIVTLALDDRLNRAEFPSHAKLMAAIRNMEGGDELFSDRILKQFISKVYNEFVQPR